jgi:hypothetical protein
VLNVVSLLCEEAMPGTTAVILPPYRKLTQEREGKERMKLGSFIDRNVCG